MTSSLNSYILCIHLFWSDTKAVVLGRSWKPLIFTGPGVRIPHFPHKRVSKFFMFVLGVVLFGKPLLFYAWPNFSLRYKSNRMAIYSSRMVFSFGTNRNMLQHIGIRFPFLYSLLPLNEYSVAKNKKERASTARSTK